MKPTTRKVSGTAMERLFRQVLAGDGGADTATAERLARRLALVLTSVRARRGQVSSGANASGRRAPARAGDKPARRAANRDLRSLRVRSGPCLPARGPRRPDGAAGRHHGTGRSQGHGESPERRARGTTARRRRPGRGIADRHCRGRREADRRPSGCGKLMATGCRAGRTIAANRQWCYQPAAMRFAGTEG